MTHNPNPVPADGACSRIAPIVAENQSGFPARPGSTPFRGSDMLRRRPRHANLRPLPEAPMRRRDALALLAGAALPWPLPARARQAELDEAVGFSGQILFLAART